MFEEIREDLVSNHNELQKDPIQTDVNRDLKEF